MAKLSSIPAPKFLYKLVGMKQYSVGDFKAVPASGSSAGVGVQNHTDTPWAISMEERAMGTAPEKHDVPAGASSVTLSPFTFDDAALAVKAAFDLLVLLALRENRDDKEALHRAELHEFITHILGRMHSENGTKTSYSIQDANTEMGDNMEPTISIDLHSAVVWTDFNSEIFIDETGENAGVSSSSLRSPLPFENEASTSAASPRRSEIVKLGNIYIEHRLGFNLRLLSLGELVTSARKAVCFLQEISNEGLTAGKDQTHSLDVEFVATPLNVPHGSCCLLGLFVQRNALHEIGGTTLRCFHFQWADHAAVSFKLGTLCVSSGKSTRFHSFSMGKRIDEMPQRRLVNGCWPSPLRQALLAHKLAVPNAAFGEAPQVDVRPLLPCRSLLQVSYFNCNKEIYGCCIARQSFLTLVSQRISAFACSVILRVCN